MITKIKFDKAKFLKDREGKSESLSTNIYLYVDLDDGTYYWQNNILNPNSLLDILKSSIVVVEQKSTRFTLFDEGKDIKGLLEIYDRINSEELGPGDELRAILFPYKKDREDLSEMLLNKKEYLTLKLGNELKYLIEYLEDEPRHLLNCLFLAMLSFLAGKGADSKLYIKLCLKIINDRRLYRYRSFFFKLYSLFEVSEFGEDDYRKIHVIRETEKSLNKGDPDEKLYVLELIQSLKDLGYYQVVEIYGQKNEILQKFIIERPKVLLFIGHGNQSDGYSINEGLKLENPYPNDFFDKNDLSDTLKQLGYNNLTIFDLVCTGDHFSNDINYPYYVTLFSNRNNEEATFNFPSAYYYSLGFFKKYLTIQDLETCHQAARISLSLFSIDYIDTYYYIKGKNFD